ncbi:radical SAM protein [bacterium]|nr:radical SAM protein [bacterium]
MKKTPKYLSDEQIQNWKPYSHPPKDGVYKRQTKQRMQDYGQWHDYQMAGRRWPIGCVSLEITQRCNLDCTLCYLSDASEAVKDIPLAEVYKRLDDIYEHFGPETDIQISGGDPTLRKREELIAIVEYAAQYRFKTSLFTNGILAKRDLLLDLKQAGLVDVAFHVDLTQERKGFNTEIELNRIREKYIEAAHGTGLNIFFNTTVYEGNFHEIPDLVRFFNAHADKVDLASFQLQADTGRGVLRERDFMITPETVSEKINAGAGCKINFDVANIGHHDCNRYGIALVAGNKAFNFLEKTKLFKTIIQQSAEFNIDREEKSNTGNYFAKLVLTNPSLWLPLTAYVLRKLWAMKGALLQSKGKVQKMTYFIHNFMDEKHLDEERCESCVFMVATPQGPISMCVHNAKRDDFILQNLTVKKGEQEAVWNPLTGTTVDNNKQNPNKNQLDLNELPVKRLKGRYRQKKINGEDSEVLPVV